MIFHPRRNRWASSICSLALLVALVSAGCRSGPEPPPPPRPTDRSQLDRGVEEAIDATLAELAASPADLEIWTRLAMVYHANELFEPARDSYEFLVTADPDNPRLWYYAALLRQKLDDDEGAFAAIARTIELDDAYAPAHARLGDWLFDRGEAQRAESAFRRAIELNPADPAGRIGVARVMLESDQPAEAAQLLEELLARGSTDPYVHLLLGSAYRQLGRVEEARGHLQQGEADRQVRDDPWMAEVMRHRAGFAAAVGVASTLLLDGENKRAVKMFEELRLEKPDDLRVLTKLGIGYLRLGRTAESLLVLREAERLYPDHYKTHLQLASALQLSDDPEGALNHIDRAIELKPASTLAHARRGTILKRAERPAEAVESFRQALTYTPGDPRLLTELGDCHGALEEWPQAASAYAEALRRETGNAELYMRLGIASFAMENYEEAASAFEQAMRLSPKHPDEVSRLLNESRSRLRQAG